LAAAPTPQPAGSPDAGAGVSPADQQANPLQVTLAKLTQVLQQMADQNPTVSDDLMQAKSALVSALQKTMMSAQPQANENPAPQQG
jgi:hypothetical protein